VQTPLTPPNQVEGAQHISQATSDALSRALAKNPADRFLSYDELRMALEGARSELLVRQYSSPESSQQPKRMTGWWRKK
jgi:serine/threonine protein kinase